MIAYPQNRPRLPNHGALCRFHAMLLLWIMLTAFTAAEEYDIKAAYLYNLAKLTQWSSAFPSGNDIFGMCVFGADPFGNSLEPLRYKLLDGHPIRVLHPHNTQDFTDCRVIFISRSENRHLSSILTALKTMPVITASDIAGFVDKGGMVGFSKIQNTIRLEINTSASDKVRLKFSAKLLEVAYRRIGNTSKDNLP